MSPTRQTRSKNVNAASSKGGKQQASTRAPKGNKRHTSTPPDADEYVELTATEKKVLEYLTAKQDRFEKQEAAARQANFRKRTINMTAEDASEDEDEEDEEPKQPKHAKRPRLRPNFKGKAARHAEVEDEDQDMEMQAEQDDKLKKGASGGKVVSTKAKNSKKARFPPPSDGEDSGAEEERGTDTEEEEEESSTDQERDHDSNSSIMFSKGKHTTKGTGKRRQGSSGVARKHIRNHALVMDLPDSVRPVKNMGALYLKMHITLEQAWTMYDGSTNDRLSDRHEVLKTVMTMVVTHKNKDGTTSSTGLALDELRGEEDKVVALRKMVLDLVWQGASQMRNDLKKKAKQVVDEAYGFAGLTAPKKEALAMWLLKTYKQSVKGGYAYVPYFTFPVKEVVWTDGQKSKGGSQVNEQKSKLANTKLLQHPAIAKLIYAFWFSLSHKEVRDWREKFSSVPDNLIALVCNALEAAIKDHLQTSASNALDLQFSNKIYAPKWNDHMTILEEMCKVHPEVYQHMKSGIWTRVNLKIKEDDKGFNWDDISADDVEEMEREEDKMESEDEDKMKDRHSSMEPQ
ncbi:hypothetical protein EVJ58_g9150 [Rhodofomes roseus]|uniref:DUF6532 domain-containing protein n=1 Tax=Rhodofomes roseus TaxID=34475 RepID=A0A4Y9XZB7_9APHY|nr:hypothetical protein EVJ58_g9150 [Rhodofomes roseus]